MTTETLRINDKWSVSYDTANNDRPVGVIRYEQPAPADSFHPLSFMSNFHLAMFYRILELEEELKARGVDIP